jgi:hypothetical protein
MNTNNHSTKTDWAKAYRLARLSESSSDDSRSLAARHTRYIGLSHLYVAALTALANRHSHTANLMARPIPHQNADWLVNFRCSQYSRASGRLPV